MIDFRKKVKVVLAHRDISEAELARILNTSSQNLNNKLERNNPKLDDMEQIANALNCDLELNFIDKNTNEKY